MIPPPGSAQFQDELRRLDAKIAEIDRAICRQLDEILHHEEFQRLEATWTGVRLMVEAAPAAPRPAQLPEDGPESRGVIVSIWNLSLRELREDLKNIRDNNFNRSTAYEQIYNQAYNIFGGIPFALLVVDQYFSDYSADVSLLKSLARLGQSSFTAVICGARPELFDLDRFDQLYSVVDETPGEHRQALAALFGERSEAWKDLRRSDEARFLAVALPRTLMRRPYDYRRGLGRRAATAGRGDVDSLHRLPYRERVAVDGSQNLWGNAAFSFAAVAIDCFVRTAWLADLHGLPRGDAGAGATPTKFQECDQFETDSPGVLHKPLTDVVISDMLEKELAEHGLMALTHRPQTNYAAFCSTPSLHQTADSTDVDQRMGAMFHYTLCVSRFAHAIKKLGHHRAGDFTTRDEVAAFIREYLLNYELNDDDPAPEKTAERPLRSFDVSVEEQLRKKGSYHCRIMLQPHHEMDAARVELSAEMVGAP